MYNNKGLKKLKSKLSESMKEESVLIGLSIMVVFSFITTGFVILEKENSKNIEINSFESCVEAGHSVTKNYPRQCVNDWQTFTESVSNESEKLNLIRLWGPRPGEEIKSPLTIKGEAKGTWFFEGDFPIILTDWDGKIIAEGYATAKDQWMTEDFVEFEGTLNFEKPDFGENGFLILKKDNPSDHAEFDDALEIPVKF